MANFPIRFRAGQGLEASTARNTQTGLLELSNADVSKRDTVEKRAGAEGVALTRSSDDTDLIPASSTRAIWYREQELVLQTQDEIYARQSCATEGSTVTLGTATGGEIAQATDLISDRAATVQSFDLTVGTDALAANVRARLDRSDTTDAASILVNPPDPDDVDIVVDVVGSQVRWTATNTITGTVNGPNPVPGATAKRLPRIMVVTGGVGLDVVITWISQDGTDAKLNALGLIHQSGTNASFDTVNYLNLATLRGGWAYARHEARDGIFAAFDSGGVLRVWPGNSPLDVPEAVALAGGQTAPSASHAYSFDLRAPSSSVSSVCGFAWASAGEVDLRMLVVTPSTGVVVYQAQESYYAAAATTTVAIQRSDPGGQPDRYVCALRRSGIDYDPVFELSASNTIRYADLDGSDLTVQLIEAGTQLRYTHARGAVFLVPFAVFDTGVSDASFEGLGNAIYGGYLRAGLREVQYDTTLEFTSTLRQAGVTQFAPIVQGSGSRLGLACFDTPSTLRIFLRASALDPALNTTTITAPFSDFGSYPFAAAVLLPIAVNDANLRVHALRADGVTLHTMTVETLAGVITADSQRSDTLPAGVSFLSAVALGVSPRTLLGVRYAGGQTEIYEIDTNLFVRVSPPTISLPGGNWTLRGPWTQHTLLLDAVRNLGDSDTFRAADAASVRHEGGECTLLVAELDTGGVVAYSVSTHLESSVVIDAAGARPRVVRIDDDTLLVAYVTAAADIAYSYWTLDSGFSFVNSGITLTPARVWDLDSGTFFNGLPAAIIAYRSTTTDVGFMILRPGEADETFTIPSVQDAPADIAVQVGPDVSGNNSLGFAWAAVGENLATPSADSGQAAVAFGAPSFLVVFFTRTFLPSATPVACSVGSQWFGFDTRVWVEIDDGAYNTIEFWTITDIAANLSGIPIRQAAILSGQRRLEHSVIGGVLAGWFALHGSLADRSGLFCYSHATGEFLSRAAVGRTESLALRNTRSVKQGWTLGLDSATVLAPILRQSANGETLEQLARLVLRPSGANRPARVGLTCVSAHAGYPRAYDGLSVFEHDWHETPLIDSVTGVAGVLPAGTYNGAVRWEWIDAEGLAYRSAPTFWSVSLGANQTIRLVVRALRISERQNVRLVFYRGARNAGVPYYRVTDVAAQVSGATIQTDLSATDADIGDNEQLDQIPGGVLQSRQGSITDFCAFASDRLFGPDPERRSLVRFTVPRAEGFPNHWVGTQGLENPSQTPAVALVEQSGRIVVVARPGLAATEGAGPDRTGAGSYPALASIPSDEGGLSQSAHALTSEGFLYGSPLGPRLLRGSLDSVPLGAPLERLFKVDEQPIHAIDFSFPFSSCYLLSDSPDPSLASLRWHVETNRWSRDTLRQAKDATALPGGNVALLTLDGRVLVEGPDVYTDDSQPYETTIRSPWLRAPKGDLTTTPAFQAHKIYILGAYIGPHDLNVDVFYDLSETPEVTRVFPSATLADDFAKGLPYVYELRLDRACFALSVRVFDGAEPNATFRLEAIDVYWSQVEARPAETHSRSKSVVR